MTATITPDKDAPTWFWVQSRSGHEPHLVDVAYQEEPWQRPRIICSCWDCFAKGMKVCDHIRQVVDFLAQSAPGSAQDAPQTTLIASPCLDGGGIPESPQ